MPQLTIHFNVYLHLKYQTSWFPTSSYHLPELANFPLKHALLSLILKGGPQNVVDNQKWLFS